MSSLTKEQVEQKLQQLKQLTEEVNALTKELVEAGAIELSEEDLDKATGGTPWLPITESTKDMLIKMGDKMQKLQVTYKYYDQ